MYPGWAAFALGWEDIMGLIESGKVADFITLDRDPFAIPASELGSLNVASTHLNGEQVYFL